VVRLLLLLVSGIQHIQHGSKLFVQRHRILRTGRTGLDRKDFKIFFLLRSKKEYAFGSRAEDYEKRLQKIVRIKHLLQID
jgi:hypothetical protein